MDRVLLASLLIALFTGSAAMSWGRFDCLNPDATAFRSIRQNPPLHPGRFDKPPFHTYINNTLFNEPSKWPARIAVFFGADKERVESVRWQVRLFGARLLQAMFFLGCVVCVYLFGRDHFGLAAARTGALVLATSAGFLPFKIYLTTDLPVTFWILASLVASGRILLGGGMPASLVAGVCAGFAAATKYNGVAVALAIPIAHVLYRDGGGFWSFLRRPAFWAGGIIVPVAFLFGNPYALLDYPTFSADFMYNYVVTPIYGGQTGSGYPKFFAALPEIFGWPLCLLLPGLILLGAWWSLREPRRSAWQAMVIAAACFALYAWKIGAFPRIETRFVLPAAPFLLLLAAPGWQALAKAKPVLIGLVAALCLYGLASAFFVSRLFTQDPRMLALEWAESHLPEVCTLDASNGSPKWRRLKPGITVNDFPVGLERNQRFSQTLANNDWVKARLAENLANHRPEFFSVAELTRRNPDFITVDALAMQDSIAGPFLRQLVDGRLGYSTVFKKDAPISPSWVFPRRPSALPATFYILAKSPAQP